MDFDFLPALERLTVVKDSLYEVASCKGVEVDYKRFVIHD